MKRTKKTTKWSGLIVALSLILASAARADPEALVRAAWEANPSLPAIEAKIEAMEHKVPQARAWTDPMFGVEYSNAPVDTFDLGEHPMTGVQFKLQQTFPFPGTTGRRVAAAEAMAAVPRMALAEKRNELRRMVRTIYWNLALTRRLESITRRHIAEVEQLLASVKSRYEVGGAGQHDLLRLEVLHERLIDDLGDFTRQIRQREAAINALLSRPAETRVATPGALAAVAPQTDAAAYFEEALTSRPVLAMWDRQAEAERAAADSAAIDGLPDPTLWAGYRVRDEVRNDAGAVVDEGTDFVSVGLSIPIPVNYGLRSRSQEKEHLALQRRAERTRDAAQDAIRGDLEAGVAGWARAYDKAVTYNTTLIPAQRAALESTLSAYRVGRADFTSLYEAEVGLLDLERMLVTARAGTRIHEAAVEALVGRGILDDGETR